MASSEPWLKVWASQMRGDPELFELLGFQGQIFLVHAWDMARDESTPYGELRLRDGRPYTPEIFARAIPGANIVNVRRWWAIVSEHYADVTLDGALVFRSLEKYQRGSQAAVRKARQRAKQRDVPRDSERDAVTPNVTGEDRGERIEKEPNPVVEQPARRDGVVDEVWTAYRRHHPKAVLTDKRRKLIRLRLADGYEPARLVAAIEGNHVDPHCNGDNDRGQPYHGFDLILRDAEHIERYAELAGQANGHVAGESRLERARRLTREAGGASD